MGGQRADATLWSGDEASYLKIGHNENQRTWKVDFYNLDIIIFAGAAMQVCVWVLDPYMLDKLQELS